MLRVKLWLLIIGVGFCCSDRKLALPVAEIIDPQIDFLTHMREYTQGKEWYGYMFDNIFKDYAVNGSFMFFYIHDVDYKNATMFSCIRVFFEYLTEKAFRIKYFCHNDPRPFNSILVFRNSSGTFFFYENVEWDLCQRDHFGRLCSIRSDGISYISISKCTDDFASNNSSALFVDKSHLQNFSYTHRNEFPEIPNIMKTQSGPYCNCFPAGGLVISRKDCILKGQNGDGITRTQQMITILLIPVILGILFCIYKSAKQWMQNDDKYKLWDINIFIVIVSKEFTINCFFFSSVNVFF